jgi:hypothetical protein
MPRLEQAQAALAQDRRRAEKQNFITILTTTQDKNLARNLIRNFDKQV